MIANEQIRRHLKQLLEQNTVSGYSRLLNQEYCYIKPARGRYPYQYWWDTGFHIYMLCCLGNYELAKRNLTSLFAVQEPTGFVGHIVFWKNTLPGQHRDIFQAKPTLRRPRPHMSALIQPPVAAQALERIWQHTQDRGFLQDMLPKVTSQLGWLVKNRDFDGDGLLTIITPFESGMDWSPMYDPVVDFNGRANYRLWWKVVSVDLHNFLHRYRLPAVHKTSRFQVKDVVVNTFYALDLLALARLYNQTGNSTAAHKYQQQAEQVRNSIGKLMFHKKDLAFYGINSATNQQIAVTTPTTLYPLALGILPDNLARRMVTRHLQEKSSFNTTFPVPSVGTSQSAYNPEESLYIWRGPTWVIHNWMLYRCLARYGLRQEADRLLATVKKLITKSGFREYYHPDTGEGYGAEDFTWSGLVVDMLRMQKSS